jgi:hypothetical protein
MVSGAVAGPATMLPAASYSRAAIRQIRRPSWPLTIADKISVKTWNNVLSDDSDGTLIDSNSELFKTASST